MVYTTWSSPVLAKLTQDESYAGIKLTSDEASWVASVNTLGMLVGSFPAAWLLDKIGRKKSMLLSGVLLFLPWIPLTFPINGLMIILPRFVAGLGGSFVAAVNPIYLGEIADKDIRGKLVAIHVLLGTCANVLVLVVGPFIPYKFLNLLCACFPLLFLSLFVFAPESPYYLVMTDKTEEAKKSLRQLLSQTEVDSELHEIEATVQNDMNNKPTFKELFTRSDYRKSLGIIAGLRTLEQLSGSPVMNSYLQTIMEMTNTKLSAEWISVIFGALQLPSALLSVFLVDHLGRKPLLTISSLGTCIALIILGVFFYLDKTDINLTNVSFLPVLCVTMFTLALALGIQPLTYVIFSELFATNFKRIGSLFFMFYGFGLGFISIKVFEPVSEALGIYVMFWFFGICCFLGFLFSIFVLPETKNKSLSEIQEMLNKNKEHHEFSEKSVK